MISSIYCGSCYCKRSDSSCTALKQEEEIIEELAGSLS